MIALAVLVLTGSLLVAVDVYAERTRKFGENYE